MRFLTFAATAAALVAVSAALAAPAAQALTPRTVFGTVTCKQGHRSSPPVAVWVVAEKGESGGRISTTDSATTDGCASIPRRLMTPSDSDSSSGAGNRGARRSGPSSPAGSNPVDTT